MDKPKTGPKDFFLWAGAMIALYVSVFSLLALFFEYIDFAFPDALNSYIDPYSSGIRFAIASLVVMFPVFLLLMHFIRADIARHPAKKDLWIRRWALVLTIFVAGLTIVIDLITLINTYLGGEITTHFVLKALLVFLVASAGLMHFLADIWGYWDTNPRYARSIAIAVSVLVIATVLSGFLITGTPGQVRLYRFDDQKVNDLQNIQSEIVTYWQEESKLPASLTDLNDSINGFSVPVDEESGAAYGYAATSALSFKLCATFNAPTQSNSPTVQSYSYPVPAGASGSSLFSDSWYHSAGSTCFARTIDPKRYPRITAPTTTTAVPAK
jgi:hypothetical protein